MNEDYDILIQELEDAKINLIGYMKSKIKIEDWHAVQDAASDIREIEARMEVFKLMQKKVGGGK